LRETVQALIWKERLMQAASLPAISSFQNPTALLQFSFPYEHSLKAHLAQEAQDLIGIAEAAAEKAYAPYSKFKTGAALLLSDGRILSGANQENASYPAGICAERVALALHDMNGSEKLKALAIAYKAADGDTHPPLAPCGICRQSILETQLHQGSPIIVYMSSPDGEVIIVEDASFLLPFHFSGEYLGTGAGF
jgi:cytidine deaminase